MKADGQIAVDRDIPQRFPIRVAEQRLAVVLRLAGEENSLVAFFRAAAHFFHRGIDIPERDRGDGQQAARICRRPLGLPIIVDADASQHQLRIVELQKLLRTEAADVGVHDHRPDAHFVHVLEARVRIVCARMHLIVVLRWMLEGAPTRSRGHADASQGAAVADPPALPPARISLDEGHPVAHVGGRAAGPQVWSFGDMGIGIDNGVTAHGIPRSTIRSVCSTLHAKPSTLARARQLLSSPRVLPRPRRKVPRPCIASARCPTGSYAAPALHNRNDHP